MIKPSAILLLLALFFVLMTGYLLIPASRPQVQAPAANGEKLVKEFNFDSVKAIEIKKGDAQVKIEKKDGNWVLPMQKNRPARKDRIETQLIKDLKDAKLEDTRPGKDSLFILSRVAPMPADKLQAILDSLQLRGFDVDHLVFDRY